jgi:hypothetical protein
MQAGETASPEDKLNPVEELLKKAKLRPAAVFLAAAPVALRSRGEADGRSLYFGPVSAPEGRALLMTEC